MIEYYQEHNERMKSLIGIDITAATLEHHVTSMKHVNDFIRMRFKNDDLDFSKVDYSFITDYEHYLKVVRKCNHNTTMKYIKNFDKIMRLAISEQIITFNPMDKFKVTYKTVHREVLSNEEIKLLVNLEVKDERLDRVRDLLLFCIYTGLAFIDLSKLKMNNIVKGKEGTRWIKSTRCKSDIAFMIPLLSIPSKIIEKYKDYPKRSIDGTVLPNLTNQKYNSYLKELALRTGINKNLTSHIGRHTFATTITLNEGVPLEVVSKMLGHSNTRTTQLYAKVLEKGIQDGMRKLMDDDLDAVAV
ncbi:MAG: site-specific integrase [Prolixibacteraceae bacterium]|nr:site-specific integrase [Prolixibacteraceae bacterium]